MNSHLLIGGVAVVAVVGALWFMNSTPAEAPVGQYCTMDAKLCPDGSYVSRSGPNCEFAQCPVVATTTSGGGRGILPYNSGVKGSVLLGPTCPVMRDPPDPQCADKPYETTITVRRASSGLTFAVKKSDVNGAFEFSLPPGQYTLSASGGKMLPRCNDENVTVGASSYTTVNISCDTGIR